MFKSDVVRIGSIIIFHLSKLCKAKFHTVLCDQIFVMRLQEKFEIDHLAWGSSLSNTMHARLDAS